MLSSQSDDEITPAQKSRNKTTKPYPSWFPPYFPSPIPIFQNRPTSPYNHEDNIPQTPQTQSCNQITLEALLPKLLPLLIKLLFATEITTKIEVITEIGTILKLDQVVGAALKTISLGSTTPEQTHA